MSINSSVVVAETPLQKGIYRHFKGNLYEVLELAMHSETREEYVVYRALYGERGLWVRPLSMFIEQIERDGCSMARFEFLRPSQVALPE